MLDRYIYTEFTLYRVILSSVASAGWCGGAQPAGLHHPGLHSLGVSLNATAPTQSSLQSQPSTKQLTCCQHSTLTLACSFFSVGFLNFYIDTLLVLLRAPRQCPTLSNFKSLSRFSVTFPKYNIVYLLQYQVSKWRNSNQNQINNQSSTVSIVNILSNYSILQESHMSKCLEVSSFLLQ